MRTLQRLYCSICEPSDRDHDVQKWSMELSLLTKSTLTPGAPLRCAIQEIRMRHGPQRYPPPSVTVPP